MKKFIVIVFGLLTFSAGFTVDVSAQDMYQATEQVAWQIAKRASHINSYENANGYNVYAGHTAGSLDPYGFNRGVGNKVSLRHPNRIPNQRQEWAYQYNKKKMAFQFEQVAQEETKTSRAQRPRVQEQTETVIDTKERRLGHVASREKQSRYDYETYLSNNEIGHDILRSNIASTIRIHGRSVSVANMFGERRADAIQRSFAGSNYASTKHDFWYQPR